MNIPPISKPQAAEEVQAICTPPEPTGLRSESAEFLYRLGLDVINTSDREPNFEDAALYFKVADTVRAREFLGTMTFYGVGVPQNHTEAARLLLRARTSVANKTLIRLATHLFEGFLCNRNPTEAIRILEALATREAYAKIDEFTGLGSRSASRNG